MQQTPNYHAASESIYHLFIHCPFATRIWHFFTQRFNLPYPPNSVLDLWGIWRSSLSGFVKEIGDLLIRAITWNIQLERNTPIFNDNFSLCTTIMEKILCMTVSWISTAPKAKRAKLEDSSATAKHSLEFLGHRKDACNPDASALQLSLSMQGVLVQSLYSVFFLCILLVGLFLVSFHGQWIELSYLYFFSFLMHLVHPL